jgi:hypothetical protein
VRRRKSDPPTRRRKVNKEKAMLMIFFFMRMPSFTCIPTLRLVYGREFVSDFYRIRMLFSGVGCSFIAQAEAGMVDGPGQQLDALVVGLPVHG